MSRLSALLPVAHGVAVIAAPRGVAVIAAPRGAADTATTTPGGDPRSRGQLTADTLVSLVTGQHLTGCDPCGVPVYGPAASTDAAGPTDPAAAAGSHPDPAPESSPSVADAPSNIDLRTGVHLPPEADSDSDGDGDGDGDGDDQLDSDRSDNHHLGAEISDPTVTDDDDSRRAGEAVASTGPAVASSEFAIASTNRADPAGTGSAVACGCGNTAARPAALHLNLIITDRTLLAGDQEPAHRHGHGPIPAPLARAWALGIGHADTGTRSWVQRPYTDPDTSQLVAMDSRKRLFPEGAQRFSIARDQTRHTPWCDAPIRHLDHIVPHTDGGPTAIDNGRGLCQSCNLTKEAPAWHSNLYDTIIEDHHPHRTQIPQPPTETTQLTTVAHTRHFKPGNQPRRNTF